MKILYIGDDNKSSTSYHRAQALERLHHTVNVINPKKYLANSLIGDLKNKFHYLTGYSFLQKKMQGLIRDINELKSSFDLIWVNGGEFLGANIVTQLKDFGTPVILYNNDDPTGKRDGNRFKQVKDSLKYYDLTIVRVEKEASEFKTLGTKNLLKVYMSYDEIVHKSIPEDKIIPDEFKSEVVFIGTWMRREKRDELILKFIQANLPISIWGGRWEKSSHWNQIKPYYRGGSLGGQDYSMAIQGSKICLGLLSSGNRDLHTRRSVEIPYSGGLLCAQRTTIHESMYKDGEEAIFWDNAEECIMLCKKILADDVLRKNIREGGMRRVKENRVGNEDICNQIINEIYRLGIIKS